MSSILNVYCLALDTKHFQEFGFWQQILSFMDHHDNIPYIIIPKGRDGGSSKVVGLFLHVCAEIGHDCF